MHWHTSTETVVVLEGAVDITLDGASHTATAGSYIIIPGEAHHAWRVPADARTSCFSPDEMARRTSISLNRDRLRRSAAVRRYDSHGEGSRNARHVRRCKQLGSLILRGGRVEELSRD